MKPKYAFILRHVFVITVILTSFLIVTWIVNMLIYKIRTQHLLNYLEYGKPGLNIFMLNMPIFAVLLAATSFFAGIVLLKKFDICYKKSLVLIITILISIIALSAFMLDHRGVNNSLEKKALLWQMYHNPNINPDWVLGSLIYKDSKVVYIKSLDGKIFRALRADTTVAVPNIRRSECLKIKGVISNDNTIIGANFYECPYAFSK